MKALPGLVLGTAAGQLFMPIIVDLAGLGPAFIAFLMFVYIFLTYFIASFSADWGFTGKLLGVFGSMQLLAGNTKPQSAAATQATLAGAYMGIVCSVLAIVMVTVVDLFLARNNPQQDVKDAYKAFLSDMESFARYLLPYSAKEKAAEKLSVEEAEKRRTKQDKEAARAKNEIEKALLGQFSAGCPPNKLSA